MYTVIFTLPWPNGNGTDTHVCHVRAVSVEHARTRVYEGIPGATPVIVFYGHQVPMDMLGPSKLYVL